MTTDTTNSSPLPPGTSASTAASIGGRLAQLNSAWNWLGTHNPFIHWGSMGELNASAGASSFAKWLNGMESDVDTASDIVGNISDWGIFSVLKEWLPPSAAAWFADALNYFLKKMLEPIIVAGLGMLRGLTGAKEFTGTSSGSGTSVPTPEQDIATVKNFLTANQGKLATVPLDPNAVQALQRILKSNGLDVDVDSKGVFTQKTMDALQYAMKMAPDKLSAFGVTPELLSILQTKVGQASAPAAVPTEAVVTASETVKKVQQILNRHTTTLGRLVHFGFNVVREDGVMDATTVSQLKVKMRDEGLYHGPIGVGAYETFDPELASALAEYSKRNPDVFTASELNDLQKMSGLQFNNVGLLTSLGRTGRGMKNFGLSAVGGVFGYLSGDGHWASGDEVQGWMNAQFSGKSVSAEQAAQAAITARAQMEDSSYDQGIATANDMTLVAGGAGVVVKGVDIARAGSEALTMAKIDWSLGETFAAARHTVTGAARVATGKVAILGGAGTMGYNALQLQDVMDTPVHGNQVVDARGSQQATLNPNLSLITGGGDVTRVSHPTPAPLQFADWDHKTKA